MRTGIAVAAAAALAFGISAHAAPPPEIADCRVFRVWRFETDAEGWEPDNNVSPFAIENSILKFTVTGPDPWILNSSPGEPNAAEFRFLGIRMRSSVDGQNQIYFSTDRSPGLDESKAAAFPVQGGGDFRFYEVDLSQTKTWEGRITALRIDTVNGTDEVGAEVEIDWIALYQAPARLAVGRPYAGEDTEGAFVSLQVTNSGGESSGPLVVTSAGRQQQLEPIEPKETRRLRFRVEPRPEIDFRGAAGGRTLFEGAVVSPFEKGAAARDIANDTTLLRLPDTEGIGGASLFAVSDGRPVLMGVFRPLAALAYRDSDGVFHYVEMMPFVERADSTSATLRSRRPANGGTAEVKWTFALPEGRDDGTMECELTCTAPLDIVRFEGPRLLAGEGSFGAGKTHALFPGLEYLEKDEPSGAVRHVGPKLAERSSPHPHRVTVPLMAIEAQDATVGICWDPLEEWSDGQRLPSATFESPNRAVGAANHLITLFAPSIPDFVDENTEFAARQFRLEPGKKITLKASFFARAGQSIDRVIPAFYAAHGMPQPPPVAHGVEGVIDTCFTAYTRTLYYPDENGWKSHIGIGDAASFRPHYAAAILAESLRRADPEIARRCAIDPGAQIAQYAGTTEDWFTSGALSAADAAVAAQLPDGGFEYRVTDDIIERVKEFAEISGSDQTALGDEGEVNSGLIARHLIPILETALKTGGRKYVEAGLRGLTKLNSFTVPRGAQTWEVHAHAPDIFAAGLCVEANLAGYHLTGDERYLDAARFWAYTGLPFVYSWVPPLDPVPAGVLHMDEQGEGKTTVISKPDEFYSDVRRFVNPGATIPVFGTSFYVVSWFGAAVQWCGLAWANAVRGYTALRPDPMLEAVCGLVFASGTQQQFDRGFVAGTYPDVWRMDTNVACTAFIAPDTIVDYAYSLVDEKRPTSVRSRGFDAGGTRAVFNTFAVVRRFECGPRRLDAELKFHAGQDLYSCAVGVDRPAQVMADGVTLAAAEELAGVGSGWRYDADHRALHVKHRSASGISELSIEW